MQWILENYVLLLIPFISGLVGYATNFLAVKMMFYPIEFVGIRPIFGWQGLIPKERLKLSNLAVDLILGRLIKVEDLAQRHGSQVILLQFTYFNFLFD